MTALNREELKDVLVEIFEERARVNEEDHSEHHAWIQARIEAEQDRKKMYRAVTKTAIQWSILFLLTGISYWLQTGHWPQA